MGRVKILMCLLWCQMVEYSGSQVTDDDPTFSEKYKVVREPGQESLECEIPPKGEEDLTHYRRKRMVDATLACIEDYPYTVSIRVNDEHVCTGAFVTSSNQHVLTVSDCVYGIPMANLSVKQGTRDLGGRVFSVIAVYLHPFLKLKMPTTTEAYIAEEPYYDNSSSTEYPTSSTEYPTTSSTENPTSSTEYPTSSTEYPTSSTEYPNSTTTTTTTTNTTTTAPKRHTKRPIIYEGADDDKERLPPRLHLFSFRLALLKTHYPFIPTPRLSSVILPFPRMKIPEFGHLVVTGFGNHPKTGEMVFGEFDSLRRVYVQEVKKEECVVRLHTEKPELIEVSTENSTRTSRENYTTLSTQSTKPFAENGTNTTFADLLEDELCLEGANDDRLILCKGDMGAPLVQYGGQNWTGLILGLSLVAAEDCTNETYIGYDGQLKPGLFLKISEYRGWLEIVLRKERAVTEKPFEAFSQNECELWPEVDVDLTWLRRRKKRLTTDTDLACLEDYPYTVSIRLHGMPWCGGAIIAEDWILTSAQCFDDVQKEDVTVRMGSVFRDYGGKIYSVVELVKHPQYNPGKAYPAHNLAMLQINVPIIPTVRLQPVKLAQPDIARIPAGGEHVVTGYGSVKSPLLREGVHQELRRMTVREVARAECQQAYQGVAELQDDHMCMRSVIDGVTLCSGDLGDPAVHFNLYEEDGTLFALAIHPGDGQCNSSRPAIFTRVWPARVWIDNVLRQGPPPTKTPTTTTLDPRVGVDNSGAARVEFELLKNGSYALRCVNNIRVLLDTRHVNLTAARRRRMTSDASQLVCQEDYPYTVSIRIKDELVASGAIIAKQWAITSADPFSHMFFGTSADGILGDILNQEPTIRMGSVFAKYGGRLLSIILIKLHPLYRPLDFKGYNISYPTHNLAMVKFNIAYHHSPRMQQVRLPAWNDTLLPPYGRFVVTGYGSKKSGQKEDGNMDLRATQVYPVHIEDCTDRLTIGNKFAVITNGSHLCMESRLRNVSFCRGDVGLPVVHFGDRNWTGILIGISMYYYKIDCPPGEERLPLVFEDIRNLNNMIWIQRVLGNDRKNHAMVYRRWMPKWAVIARGSNNLVTGVPVYWRRLWKEYLEKRQKG